MSWGPSISLDLPGQSIIENDGKDNSPVNQLLSPFTPLTSHRNFHDLITQQNEIQNLHFFPPPRITAPFCEIDTESVISVDQRPLHSPVNTGGLRGSEETYNGDQAPSAVPPLADGPSIEQVRATTERVFGKRPCLWQIRVCQNILRGDRDIVSIAGTGMGKTLTFWMPLPFRYRGIQIIVTPLNILGQQNIETLERAGIKGIFISAATSTSSNFYDIANFCYQVVVVNPEELMRPAGGFEQLFKNHEFTDHIISIIIDEAHCLSQWGSFRPDYRHIGRLHFIQHKSFPIVATSATLSTATLRDVKETLRFCDDSLFVSQCSVDRPNITIIVRKIVHTLKSFEDLRFVLNNWKIGDPPPPKFIIFFNNIQESIQAGLFLRSLLPVETRSRIKWFNSDMSESFKSKETRRFATGETWGLLATDSFGMGMDVSDVLLIVQWCATVTISTLWQRFGRCVRNPSLRGMAILLAEKEFFDDYQGSNKRKRAVIIKKEEGPSKHTRTSNQKRKQIEEEMLIESGTTEIESSKSNKRLPGTAMGDLINADTRSLSCRRIPFIDTFNDSKSVSLHLECDPTILSGCNHCRPAERILCCDIHNSTAFPFPPILTDAKPTASQRRSSLPVTKVGHARDPIQDEKDTALRVDLEYWRLQQTKEVFGLVHLHDLGPSLIMGTSICKRIVDCARFGKLRTVENLECETRPWSGASKYGADILKIIKTHYPTDTLPNVSKNFGALLPRGVKQEAQSMTVALTPTIDAPQTKGQRAAVQCTQCWNFGHTRRSKKCPGSNENVPPTLPHHLTVITGSSQALNT